MRPVEADALVTVGDHEHCARRRVPFERLPQLAWQTVGPPSDTAAPAAGIGAVARRNRYDAVRDSRHRGRFERDRPAIGLPTQYDAPVAVAAGLPGPFLQVRNMLRAAGPPAALVQIVAVDLDDIPALRGELLDEAQRLALPLHIRPADTMAPEQDAPGCLGPDGRLVRVGVHLPVGRRRALGRTLKMRGHALLLARRQQRQEKRCINKTMHSAPPPSCRLSPAAAERPAAAGVRVRSSASQIAAACGRPAGAGGH